MSELAVVFATETVLAHHPRTGVPVTIVAGGHWLADDPIVEAYPKFFADDPRYGLSCSEVLGEDGYPARVSAALAESETTDAPPEPKPATKPATTETTDAAPDTKRRRGGRAAL